MQLGRLTLRYDDIRGVLARRYTDAVMSPYQEGFQWDETVMAVQSRCIAFLVVSHVIIKRVDCIALCCGFLPHRCNLCCGSLRREEQHDRIGLCPQCRVTEPESCRRHQTP
jgi:hypothetical protein